MLFVSNAVAQVWYSNATVWDLLVAAENQPHVSKLLADNKLAYSVVIPDLQRAILEENPALSDEELELTGRKGEYEKGEGRQSPVALWCCSSLVYSVLARV